MGMEVNTEDYLLQHLNVASFAIKEITPEVKNVLLKDYDLIAGSILGTYNESIFENNKEDICILLNKTFFLSIIATTKMMELKEYDSIHKMIQIIHRKTGETSLTKSSKRLYNEIKNAAKEYGIAPLPVISKEQVSQVAKTFGVDKVDSENVDQDSIEIVDLEEEVDFDLDKLMDDAEEETAEEEEKEEETPEEDKDSGNENTKALIEKLKNSSISGQVKNEAMVLKNVLSSLYESGFTSFPQVGMLGNNGDRAPLIRLKNDNGKAVEYSMSDSGSSYEYKIMKAITSIIPEFNSYAGTLPGETVPTTDELLGKSQLCYKMQLQFQKANISYSKGKTSIRKFVHDNLLDGSGCADFEEWNKKKNSGKTCLTKYKHVAKWYVWCIESIIYSAIAEDIEFERSKGNEIKLIKESSDFYTVPMSYVSKVDAIIAGVDRNFRNAFVVSERTIDKELNTLVSEEIRISTGTVIDVEQIVNALNKELNTGASNSIKIRQLAKSTYEKNNVLILKIVYNEDKENKADLFAYEVTDRLLESSGAPSWDHALIGKKEDGTYLYWDDFMDPAKALPEKRCYSLYAGSRSGKGIMTSTLVASAICSGVLPFYTDGKPENGACLGRIAWEKGKEAYVWDGQPEGSLPFSGFMEDYSFSQRSTSEIIQYIDNCPSELFENNKYFDDKKQRLFLGVMRYLKSMYLCSEVIEGRASGRLPKDGWQLWIFDELTNMSSKEKELREIFAKYLRDKAEIALTNSDENSRYKLPLENKKVKELNDTGVDYIRNWNTWVEKISRNISKAATISLGKADMNLLFIFQEASWIKTDSKITAIGKVVSTLKSTKIVGKSALGDGLGEYGTANTIKSDWYSNYVNTGRGYWAISNSADLRNCSVSVFKPYKVYTIPLDSSGAISNEPISPEDSKRYVAGYINDLTSRLGIDASDLLQKAYDYANDAVVSLKYAESIKEFIYNCTNFAVTEVDASYNNLRNVVEDEQGNSSPSSSSENKNELNIGSDGELNFDGASSDQNPTEFQKEFINNNKIRRFKMLIPKILISKELTDEELVYFIKDNINKDLKLTRFDVSKRGKDPNGLLALIILLGDLVVLNDRGMLDINEYKSYLMNNIVSGNDAKHTCKVALGIIEDCISGNYPYYEGQLTLPSMDKLREWISKYSSENITNSDMKNQMFNTPQQENNVQQVQVKDGADEPIEIDTPNNVQQNNSENASPENKPGVQKQSFLISEDGEINIIPRETQSILAITPENCINAEVNSRNPLNRLQKKMFESRTGTAYQYKKRWDAVLQELRGHFKDRSVVNRVAISGSQMTVNKKLCLLDGILGGPYDIRMEDIVIFKELFKVFPMIKDLVIDSSLVQVLLREYGGDSAAIQNMFDKHKRLATICIIQAGGKSVVYNRNDNANKEVEKVLNNQILRNNLEMECAKRNPNLHEKNPGYLLGVYSNCGEISKKLFGSAGKSLIADNGPKLGKAFAHSVVGAAIGTVGLAFGAGGLIYKMFRRRYK